jgi:hypothetical protein
VKPAVVDRERLGAHFAVSSLFQEYPDTARIYSCTFEQQHRQVLTAGKAKLILGRSKVTFDITRARDVLSYAALHLGDHNVNAGVRFFRGEEAYQELVAEFTESFDRADFPQVIRLMDKHFGESYYSLKNLFRDEQRRALQQVLASTGQDIESHYRQIADQHTPLARFLKGIGAPLPIALKTAVDFVLNCDLRHEFENEDTDPARVRMLVEQAQAGNIELRHDALSYVIKGNLDRRMQRLIASPDDLPWLARTADLAEVVHAMGLEVNLWKTQNTCFQMLKTIAPEHVAKAGQGDAAAGEWVQQFNRLSEQLGFRLDQ